MKVLICDDDFLSRQFLFKALSSMNYQCVLAANGQEGIALALKELPDLILMDYTMPDMKGLDAIREIRKDSRLARTPFVLVTGSVDLQSLVEEEKFENCAFLPKPYSREQLQSTISLALGKFFPDQPE